MNKEDQRDEFSFIFEINPRDSFGLKKLLIDISSPITLELQMKQAIKQEDYELCAYIRDTAKEKCLTLEL